MTVSDKEIGLIRQCASVFSDHQGPFTLDQFVEQFANYLNRATGITPPEIYDGLKELIGDGIIVKKMTEQGLKYVHYKVAYVFPDFDGNSPKTYFEGKKMKITRKQLRNLIMEMFPVPVPLPSDIDLSNIDLEKIMNEVLRTIKTELEKEFKEEIAEFTKECIKEKIFKVPPTIPTESNVKPCVMKKMKEHAMENPEEMMLRGGKAIIKAMVDKVNLNI